jgi:uncharacterized membrane protein
MVAAVVLIVAGVLIAAAGVLGRWEKLPRNGLVGVRTAATMRSDRAFRVANRAAGPAIMLAGVTAMIGGAAAVALPSQDAIACILAGALAAAVLAVIGAVIGARAAKQADS